MADASLILEAYSTHMSPWCEMPHLTLQRLCGVYLPYNTLEVQILPAGSTTEPVHAPGPLDPTTMPETEAAQPGLRTVRSMPRSCDPLLPPR